jgi:hypothetical protein
VLAEVFAAKLHKVPISAGNGSPLFNPAPTIFTFMIHKSVAGLSNECYEQVLPIAYFWCPLPRGKKLTVDERQMVPK